jgi:hypothetical protein
MNKPEALQHALGYASGREDASGTPTAAPDHRAGWLAFADAFADGWDAYNNDRRHWMTNAQDAYATWQATSGATIFRDDQPTVSKL